MHKFQMHKFINEWMNEWMNKWKNEKFIMIINQAETNVRNSLQRNGGMNSKMQKCKNAWMH